MTISHAILFRLRFIDFLIDHYGSIQRNAIMDYFGLSMPQATLDLRAYQELAPGNIVYDKYQRAYVKTEQYKRVWQ